VETRNKISKALTGKTLPPEVKDKISKAHKGLHWTKEAKERMSQQRKGIPRPLETRNKIAKALKGRKMPLEQRLKCSKSHETIKWDVGMLRNLYIDEGFSPLDISKQQGCSYGSVLNALRRYGIPTRTQQEAMTMSRHREKISKIAKIVRNKPELKARQSQIKKELWQNAEYRAKGILANQLSGRRAERKIKLSEANKRYWAANPERKEVLGETTKTRWQNPEYRAIATRINAENAIKPEVREKQRLAHLGLLVGEKNPSWLGGKSFEPYTYKFNRQLKLTIRMRDDYTCQLCGMSETENVKKLSCHHIDYDKTNSLPNNLISLCVKCHIKTNKNRDYWTLYFNELMNKRQHNPKALDQSKKVAQISKEGVLSA
jgi:hypothetical protein